MCVCKRDASHNPAFSREHGFMCLVSARLPGDPDSVFMPTLSWRKAEGRNVLVPTME